MFPAIFPKSSADDFKDDQRNPGHHRLLPDLAVVQLFIPFLLLIGLEFGLMTLTLVRPQSACSYAASNSSSSRSSQRACTSTYGMQTVMHMASGALSVRQYSSL
ncbi:hypothetical protein BDR07DRAFT_1494791 [Suillus spraguei]|nr:hypothetical protein BDR07DRAFT_1494791 [Suillus spraguei]